MKKDLPAAVKKDLPAAVKKDMPPAVKKDGPFPARRELVAPRKDLQVIEIGEGWAVRRHGELRLLSTHDTPQEAEHAALRIAQREGTEVLVQQRDGTYRRSKAPPLPPQPVAPVKGSRARRSSAGST